MVKIKKEKVIIKPKDLKPTSKQFKVVGTFNPGATRLPNGDIVLYVRVAEKLIKNEDKNYCYSPRCEGKSSCKIKIDKFDKKDVKSSSYFDCVFKDGTKRLTFISHLRRVVLDKTGFKVKSIDKKPTIQGLSHDGELGLEDPRITKINSKYVMTYVTLSRQGNISTSYATSKDGIKWKRKGIIFRAQNKDVVIFPEKINGNYVAFNRPEGNFEFSPPHIWFSDSPDLVHWGHPKPIKLSEKGKWDHSRVGAGPPPIKIDKGWLLIYHGVTEKKKYDNFLFRFLGLMKEYSVYSVGAALFDLKNPRKLIAKTPKPIILPTNEYEKKGFVNNVVFPTGLVMDKDNKHILLFSGGSDTVVTVKKIALKDILDSLRKVIIKK